MIITNTIKDNDNIIMQIILLIYGNGGVGKTTFATTMPKPLILDFENGTKYLASRHINVDVIKMTSWLNAEEKKELAKVINNYETIVIDPIGEAMEMLINSSSISGGKYRQGDGSLTMAGWGEVKKSMRDFIKYLRNQNKNIVIIAHVEEVRDGEGIIKRPMLATKLRDEIVNFVDIVGYAELEKNERVLHLSASGDRYISKDRTGKLPQKIKLDYQEIEKYIKKNQEPKTDDDFKEV